MFFLVLFAVVTNFHVGAIYKLPGKTLGLKQSACVNKLTFSMSESVNT